MNNLNTILSLLAVFLFSASASSATKIYSAPEGIDRSSDFVVTVDGREAFVFFVAENKHRQQYLPGADFEFLGEKKVIVRNVVHDPGNVKIHKARESWVSFETEKSALISLEQLTDPLPLQDILLIDELGNAVDHKVEGEKIRFSAVAGNKYLLVLNNDLSRRLTLFAEHPEMDVPDIKGADTFLIQPCTPRNDYETTSKKTLYFAPGLHEMGDAFPLKPSLQIYLAPGAYVRGYFTCPPGAGTEGASEVKIFGRGILSSEYNQIAEGPNYNFLPRPIGFWSNSIYLGGFNREPAENQTVKGITIIYPTQQPIMGNGRKTLIENVKVINFQKGFGGICVGSESMVRDCYVSSDTRVLTTFGSDTTFDRNMVVGLKLDTPFYLGDRILDDLSHITVENLTVIGNWKTLIGVHQAHFGNLSNLTFRNFKAWYTGKQPRTTLLSLAVAFSPYRRDDYFGSISDLTVSEINITASNSAPDLIVSAFGFSEECAVRDVSVNNIRVNGEPAKLLPKIAQAAFNISLDDRTIIEGIRPVAKTPGREYPPVPAVDNPEKTYKRRDMDGDKLGWKIAHEVAYPNAKQKADPNFPKTLSAAFGNTATGASLKGIKTIASPEGNFLQTYAAVNDPRMYVLHSPDYEMTIAQPSSGTAAASVPVYENIGTLLTTGNRLVNPPPMLTEHFANFTHRGPVEVTVTMKSRAPSVKDALIMPSHLKIEPSYAPNGRSFSFTMSDPQYLVIIVNGDWLRPLFVFGNPPEDPVPDPADPAVLTIQTGDDYKTLENRMKLADYRVINFAPGYHDIGLFFPVFSKQTIYIPGDAFVAGTILGVDRKKARNHAYGTKLITMNKEIFEFPAFKHGYRQPDDFVLMDSSNRGRKEFLGSIKDFTIRGRGILSGENMDWFKGQETIPGYIILVDRSGRNGVLEGLTFTGRHFHSANFFGTPALLRNVKTLYGFHGNTDASQWGMVRRNLFSIEQDDGTYIKNGLDIDGWLAWQQNNANAFCFARSMPSDGNTLGHAIVRNVTVIDGRYGAYSVSNLAGVQYNPMRGGFWLGINHDRKGASFGYIADIVMKDIYFETIVNPLFQFAPMTGTVYNKMIGAEDITFDNIHVPMGQNWKSIFGGRTQAPDDVMRGIVIRDLMIKGKKITEFDDFARVRSNGRNLEVTIE
ncbi:hypothetical protein G0Q06_00875 [Puniceicoccales bacterium CK1056]|uniref:Uncharacterized protein n=1 Tax=Oceanipulchritudo coccoides TaxID=2706888 RepID=A0A6B2LZR4_9BACT|nr:hypothetical protein [Oceanipulchritudo coccoides]NDV60995.1 hypothetical protein [Oceanipulchritudo coccoides]